MIPVEGKVGMTTFSVESGLNIGDWSINRAVTSDNRWTPPTAVAL